MTALSYKPWLAPKLLDRSKPHTIRATRKQPIRPGQLLQHFTGMRTKACRRLGESVCLAVWRIKILPSRRMFGLMPGAGERLCTHYGLKAPLEADDLARFDGFADYKAFFDFFAPAAEDDVFEGELIFWGDTFEPAATTGPSERGLEILRNMLGMQIGLSPAPRDQWGTKNRFVIDKSYISQDMAELIAGGFIVRASLRSGTCYAYRATIAGMRAVFLPQHLIPAALDIGRRAE